MLSYFEALQGSLLTVPVILWTCSLSFIRLPVYMHACMCMCMHAYIHAGRLFQKGDIEAFGSIHKRARGVGCISIVGGFAFSTHQSTRALFSHAYQEVLSLLDPFYFLSAFPSFDFAAVYSVFTCDVLLVGASVADAAVPAADRVFSSALVHGCRALPPLLPPLWGC
jgi:hypothetical protein